MKTIGTHGHAFHADEVLACVMLKMLPEYRNARIVRSRDTRILANCDILVDVGDIYDPANHYYDHHQSGFNESLATLMPGRTNTTKLSSAGLIYIHFGRRVVEMLVGSKDQTQVEKIFEKIYTNFIEEIDALDNGIKCAEGSQNFQMTTHLSYRVSEMRPPWNIVVRNSDFDERFNLAMDLVKSEFVAKVNRLKEEWWPAREVVQEALQSRMQVHPSGRLIELKMTQVNVSDHLDDLEQELGIPKGHILFALCCANHTFRVLSIRLADKQFEERLKLKKDWWGLNNADLVRKSGISSAMFVHAGGFLGACRTRAGALEMAVMSMEEKYGEI